MKSIENSYAKDLCLCKLERNRISGAISLYDLIDWGVSINVKIKKKIKKWYFSLLRKNGLRKFEK